MVWPKEKWGGMSTFVPSPKNQQYTTRKGLRSQKENSTKNPNSQWLVPAGQHICARCGSYNVLYFSLILITKWCVCQEKAAVSFWWPYFRSWNFWSLGSLGSRQSGSKITVRSAPYHISNLHPVDDLHENNPIGQTHWSHRAMDLQHYQETKVKPGFLPLKLPQGSCVMPINGSSELKLWNWLKLEIANNANNTGWWPRT